MTGPQRSGTTICARILADDLNLSYVDEKDVGVRSLARLVARLSSDNGIVVQGPCYSSIVHWIDVPGTLVVFMMRDPRDILASQNRIQWSKYRDEVTYELSNYFRDTGEIAVVRYEAWHRYQKPMMRLPFLEVEYESLSAHALWVDRADASSSPGDSIGGTHRRSLHAPDLAATRDRLNTWRSDRRRSQDLLLRVGVPASSASARREERRDP